MPEVYEHDNAFIPDKNERKRIWQTGTDEECRDLAFGTALTALANKGVAESKMDIARFLLPTSRQYVFDETMGQLVQALQERKWKVPDISVKFYWYGPQQAYSNVDTIQGPDFRLWFCRVQSRISSHCNDTAAVTQLNIPRKQLDVFEDYSGPALYSYVGDNWERDKKWFETSGKVNSKLNEEPRRYLKYHGSFYPTKQAYHENCGRHWRGKLPPYLLHDDDLGREYGLLSGDPESFKTEDVLNEFNGFFKEVLTRITTK